MSSLNPTVFIPARMESSRFPGKPLAPINAEITAMEKQTIITWLTPIRISRLAVGIKTLNINCQLLHPLILPASITSGGIALKPNKVRSIIGGTATIMVIITAA